MKSTRSEINTKKIISSLPSNVIKKIVDVESRCLSNFPLQGTTSFLCHSPSSPACHADAADERDVKMLLFYFLCSWIFLRSIVALRARHSFEFTLFL